MDTPFVRDVRQFLKVSRLSIRALAALAGVSHTSLSRALAGTRKDVKASTADAVRDAMRRYDSYRQQSCEG